jgi:hypothetical protein
VKKTRLTTRDKRFLWRSFGHYNFAIYEKRIETTDREVRLTKTKVVYLSPDFWRNEQDSCLGGTQSTCGPLAQLHKELVCKVARVEANKIRN